MSIKMSKIATIFLSVLLFNSFVCAQNNAAETGQYNSILKRNIKKSEIFSGLYTAKKSRHYSTKDWRLIIDNYWGKGLPSAEKLKIFDSAVERINKSYAAFQNLQINFDSITAFYRSEVENGVSRGRFAAIMNHMSFALKEAHTVLADIPVNFGTEILRGVPLFVIGPWQDNSRFGASLTPLPDSSLLVYRALPSHKLGLTRGDIILGYDGIPWKKLYKNLLNAELPIHPNGVWASSDKSLTHCLLASAGLNWHLYDTIDVVKTTNDTLHLSTIPLSRQKGFIWGNEQLPVAGVSFPDFYAKDFVSWGIVTGSNIGYIYVASWNPDAEYKISSQFYNAVDSLMNIFETDGLILDFRNNDGGWMGVAHAGYSLLFQKYTPSVAFDIRSSVPDHYSMIPHPTYNKTIFTIPGLSSPYYNKPIAVLTGPGAISNGDFESWRMKLHPMARLFGKSSCGAFATAITPSLNNEDWFFYLTYGNAYPVNSPGEYMVHTDLPIDDEVWLTREGVLNGRDDVVNKALEWIKTTTGLKENIDIPLKFCLEQNYPNPFNPTTTIKYNIPYLDSGTNNPEFVSLIVYDILGREVTTLVNQQQNPGRYKVLFNGGELGSGVYFYSLRYSDYSLSRKMLLVK